MSNKVDWKQKYMEIRSKYMNAIDTAFRLGVQEGQRIAELENMQMQLQQAQEQATSAAQAAAAQSQMGGMPGEEMPPEEGGGMPGEEMPPEEGGGMPGEEMPPEEGGDELGQSIDELEQYVKNESKNIDFAKLMKKMHTMTKSESSNISEKQSKVKDILSKWEKQTK